MASFKKLDCFQQEIDHLRPFEGNMLWQIRAYYRLALTWTSNALGGNALTDVETKVLLEDDLTPAGKRLHDVFEAVDHAKACDYMFSLLRSGQITEENILHLHALFKSSTDPVCASEYRDVSVSITNSRYPLPPPENVKAEMKRLRAWICAERKNLHPVDFAAQLHKRFSFITPFESGNGHVARLLMNTALIQRGFLPAIIPPVLRGEYVSLLERAHQDDSEFVSFIAERELESQKDILRLLQIPFPQQAESAMDAMQSQS